MNLNLWFEFCMIKMWSNQKKLIRRNTIHICLIDKLLNIGNCYDSNDDSNSIKQQ